MHVSSATKKIYLYFPICTVFLTDEFILDLQPLLPSPGRKAPPLPSLAVTGPHTFLQQPVPNQQRFAPSLQPIRLHTNMLAPRRQLQPIPYSI